jgi:DNA-binding response OmpR family regulator
MPETANQDAGDVLIVEDEWPIAQLLEAFLTDEGYPVRIAHDAAAAWRAIETAVPALLLLDILMPGKMDGADLAQKLRAQGYTFPIIVVAATERLAQPLMHLHPIAYIAKPFDLEVILSGVMHYLPPTEREVDCSGPACA